jgi:hypothetical protein
MKLNMCFPCDLPRPKSQRRNLMTVWRIYAQENGVSATAARQARESPGCPSH